MRVNTHASLSRFRMPPTLGVQSVMSSCVRVVGMSGGRLVSYTTPPLISSVRVAKVQGRCW